MPEDRFRKAAKDGRTLLNAWLTLNSPFLIELIGQAGWDFVSIDQQHGLGGNEAMVQCLTAAKASNMPALVRVAENDPGLVGRALDAGAQGVICPLIATVEDAEAFVQAVKFPPHGNRSWGRTGHGSAMTATISPRPTLGPSPAHRSRPKAHSIRLTRSWRLMAWIWSASGLTTFP